MDKFTKNQIDGPPSSWFEVDGRKYIYGTYAIGGITSVDEGMQLIMDTAKKAWDVTRSYKEHGLDILDKNSQSLPLLVWRRRPTCVDDVSGIQYVTCRFVIIPPHRADQVREALSNGPTNDEFDCIYGIHAFHNLKPLPDIDGEEYKNTQLKISDAYEALMSVCFSGIRIFGCKFNDVSDSLGSLLDGANYSKGDQDES